MMPSLISPSRNPLVVTLEMDQATQCRFDRERTALYPPLRTAVGAHITLFHALPADQQIEFIRLLSAQGDREQFRLRVESLVSLGSGVAYRLSAAELTQLHRGLQQEWWSLLTRQDQQKLHPHITVQNKVSSRLATSTLTRLRAEFVPFDVTATGLRLWRYDGGPWSPLARFPFAGLPTAQ